MRPTIDTRKYLCSVHGELEGDTLNISIPLREIEFSFCLLCFIDLLETSLPKLEKIKEEPE